MADVSERRELLRGHHRVGGTGRVGARQCTKSQEFDGDRQRERKHGRQGVERFEPTLLDDAAGLERLVELLDLPPTPVVVDHRFDLGDRLEPLGRVQQPVDRFLTVRRVYLEDVEHVDVDRLGYVCTDDVWSTERGGRRRETEPRDATVARWMRASSRGRGRAEAAGERHLSLDDDRGSADECADRDRGTRLEGVAIVARPKNEALALLKAGRHERVRITLAVRDVKDGGARSDESGLRELDAPLP